MYLQVRDIFPNSILLESSDYHGNEDSFSYICCKPIAGFVVDGGVIQQYFPNSTRSATPIKSRSQVVTALQDFLSGFRSEPQEESLSHDFARTFARTFAHNGVFGYCSYEAVEYFEDITLKAEREEARRIPAIQYHLYQFVIALNHFTNELCIIEHKPIHASNEKALEADSEEQSLEFVASLINKKTFAQYNFEAAGEEISNFTDAEFIETLTKVKEHIFRGDVFQIVPSRRFQRSFKGDDFNLYRALRSVNPSPYLFYFDYGSVRLFGSSPEAQIIVRGKQAEIHPIAGTFRRTGDDTTDARHAEELRADPKENAEHVMLVDLARNDLSRHCTGVRVEVYREIQYYSHVIHLVSKVTGTLNADVSSLAIMADTFPAGTLSGAPKYKAMELIDRYERGSRSYYAGAVGFLDFNGDVNHAIMIRSFMSKNNTLYFQAGMGLVAGSDVQSELQEVANKLAALRRAMELAETL
jgi:anthranilate synthase component 1